MSALHANTLKVSGALLVIRLGLAYFYLVWGINKVLAAEQTTRLFEYFYDLAIPANLPYAFGIAESALAVALALGFRRRATYLVALVIHSVTIVVTLGALSTPFKIEDGFPVNRMYASSLPTWAALVALYSLRAWDRFSIDAWRESRGRAD